MRPAGLSRPKEENQRWAWVGILRVTDSSPETAGKHSEPRLSKPDCREGWVMCTVGERAVFDFLSATVTLYP